MPNSLIFAVILAVWAAYLLQHWIRRRDHVATARSVDRFSESMRVLERRQRMPRPDLSAPAPRSYSVSLTRPAHPDVVVKRAQHGPAASGPATLRPAGRGGRRRSTRPAPQRVARRRSLRPSGPVVRAVALVLGVLVLAGGITVWAMGLAPWWAAAGGGAGLLAALTVVRFSVATQRRRATSPVRAPKAQRAPRAGRRARKEARPARADERLRRSPSVVPAAAESETAGAAVTEAETLTERVTELYDVEAVSGSRADLVGMTATASSPDLTEVSAELDLPVDAVQERRPGTWAPVPVPPPTYTLKARAPRSQPGASFEDAQLPFDGNALALDEEFEELPPVHSVG